MIRIIKRYDIFKGGPGSGNFGHEGRPGEVGGSGQGGGGGGGGADSGQVVDQFRDFYNSKEFDNLVSVKYVGNLKNEIDSSIDTIAKKGEILESDINSIGSKKIKKAIKTYTKTDDNSSAVRNLQYDLAKGTKVSEQIHIEVGDNLYVINKITNKSIVKEDTVYRGLRFESSNTNDMKNYNNLLKGIDNGEIPLLSITSSSKDSLVAANMSGWGHKEYHSVVFEIENKERLLKGIDISALATVKREKEILLAGGQTLVIDKIDKKTYWKGYPDINTTVKCHVKGIEKKINTIKYLWEFFDSIHATFHNRRFTGLIDQESDIVFKEVVEKVEIQKEGRFIFKGGSGSGNFGHGGRPGRQGGSGQGGGGQGGREYITVMHGTREGVIDSILENGILPSKPIPRENTSVRELRDQPVGVYVSTEFNDASWWAAFSRRPGEDTLVFEAKIDKSLLNADPLKKGRFFTKDKILPDKLQAVSFIKSRVIREGYRTRVEGKITRKLIVNGKVEKIDNLTNEIIIFCPVVFTTTVEKVEIQKEGRFLI